MSGVLCLIRSLRKELELVRGSAQPEPSSSLSNEGQLEEEQQVGEQREDPKELDSCAPGHVEAEGESMSEAEPEVASTIPPLPLEWLLGGTSGRGVWCSRLQPLLGSVT